MAFDLATVRRIDIQASTSGVPQATAALDKLGQAHTGVNVASQSTERATVSLERKVEAITRRFDLAARAEQDLARTERDLSRARAQGLISLDRQAQLMDLARARTLGLSAANENVARSTGQIGAIANNAASGITVYTGALSGAALGGAVLVVATATSSS
ncbi:MAG: hypothetical protein B7Z14_14990 [Bosea sp. 32-68-6]|nr:MAG: hypothetical protein B7Z14_14990 [Bosea sp. 32-68-6]